MSDAARKCFQTLTEGHPCPGYLLPCHIEGMDQCNVCQSWVGRPGSEPPSWVMLQPDDGWLGER